MSWSFSNIPFLPSFFFIQLSIERTVSYTISISVTIRSFFFYNQLYVKIMHICKSVLKYYNLIFYNRLLSASLSPSRKQVLFHTVLLIAINRFFFSFFFLSCRQCETMLRKRKGKRTGGWDLTHWEKTVMTLNRWESNISKCHTQSDYNKASKKCTWTYRMNINRYKHMNIPYIYIYLSVTRKTMMQ